MNALASYFRHLIVTGILIVVEKLKLPVEGADDAANVIALAVVGTVSWWFVKFVGPKLKAPMLLLCCSLVLFTPSCSINWAGKGWPTITVDPERVVEWTNKKLDRPDTVIILPEK